MIKQFNNAKFYNQTIPSVIDLPNVPMGAVLKGSAKKYGDQVAYLYRDKELTFKELHEHATRFANGLIKLGIGRGDVVAIQMMNCTQYVVAYYGVMLTGATYSPVNALLPKDELLYQLKDCCAKVIVTYGQLLQMCLDLPALTSIETIIVTGAEEVSSIDNHIDTADYGDHVMSFNKVISENEDNPIDVDIDPETDIAHIAYTGGTTGRPKGVIITHKNIVSNILQSATWSGALPHVDEDGALTIVPVEPDKEKFLQQYPNYPGGIVRISPAPFSHGAGAMGGLAYAVLLGAKSIVFDRFIPNQFIADIETHKITELSGAPAMFNFILFNPEMEKRDLSSVRMINSGAAPIAPETMQLLAKFFPNAVVTEGYGLTEATASTIQSVGLIAGTRKIGTVGLPIYNTEVKLMSVDNPGEVVTEPGKRGEVCIKGPQIMQGYLNNPEVTAETLVDGWLHTGDIGMFDEDGFVSIVDRKKDMLIYNGYNVYPRQIEEVLYSHPAVAAAVVIGVEDPVVGEKPKAFVVLRQGVEVTEQEIIDFVNEKVVHYSRVRELEFIDQLPMTAAGKISKIQLVEREKMRTTNI